MAVTKRGRSTDAAGGKYIEKFLKKADRALQDGVRKADEVIEEAVDLGTLTAQQASKTGQDIRERAKKEKDSLHQRGAKKISEGLAAAKAMGSNTQADLDVLERLAKLCKSGIITEEEFEEKKTKILGKI